MFFSGVYLKWGGNWEMDSTYQEGSSKYGKYVFIVLTTYSFMTNSMRWWVSGPPPCTVQLWTVTVGISPESLNYCCICMLMIPKYTYI